MAINIIKTKGHSTLGGKQKTFNFIQNNRKHSFDGGNVTKTKTLLKNWRHYEKIIKTKITPYGGNKKNMQTLIIKLNL